MDLNYKILKYNVTLALILSGLFYTKHPEMAEEHFKSIVSGTKEVVEKTTGKRKSNPFDEARALASVKANAEKEEHLADEASLEEPTELTPPDEISDEETPKFTGGDPLDKKKKIVSNSNKKINPLKKMYEKVKNFLIPSPSLDEEKEEIIIGGGGWIPKKKDEPVSSGSGGNSSSCEKPKTPDSITGTLVNNQGSLSWTANSSNQVTYNVFRGTDPSNLTLIASKLTTAQYTDTSMSPGILYYYKVSSTNTCGHSLTHSNQSQIKSLGAFSILSSSSIADLASLSWSQSLGADSYVVYYGTTSGTYSASAASLSPSSISVVGGKTYYFKVQAANSYGTMDSSEIALYVPTSFSFDLTYDNPAEYLFSDDIEVINSKASLSPSNLVSEKTLLNGTGTSSDNVFDNYVYMDSNLLIDNDSIKMTSGTSATYISKVFDGKNDEVSWTKMNFISSLPFGKEIALSQESGYQDSVTDFTPNLRFLYHLNGPIGTSIPNGATLSSPITGHSSTAVNPDGLGLQFAGGKLKQSLRLDGVNDYLVTNYTQTSVTAYSIALWMRTTTTGVKKVFVHNRGTGAGKSLTLGMGTTGGNRGSAGQISWEVDSNSIDIGISSNQTFNDGQWHHVVGTWAADSGVAIHPSQFKIYVDGNLVTTHSSITGAATSPLTGLGTTLIGYHQPWGSFFPGDLDEIAIWNRSLSLAEIQELYIRGANKVKIQLRTCSSKLGLDCAGTISNWTGIDGTNLSYFGESENNLSPLSNVGIVNSSFFQTPFSLFTGGLTSWLATGKNGKDRYIQYKASFESTTSLSYPDLSKVSFEPSTRYALSSTVVNNIANAIDINYISSLAITHTCSDSNNNMIDDDIKYDISLDEGTNYYAYHSGIWTISSSAASANTKAELEVLTQNEFKTIPTSNGKLLIRTYLTSNGTSACEVDNIKINGAK